MQTDYDSTAMQGIVGMAQTGVVQSFGKMVTTKGSRAVQGQLSEDAFAAMFRNDWIAVRYAQYSFASVEPEFISSI